MNANNFTEVSTPPRLIPSFLEGFNSVANHIQLIILPVLLDLILWFAPRVNVKSLFLPIFNEYLNFFSQTGSPEIQSILVNTQTLWEEVLVRYNLLSTLHTLPIGVPSLLAGRGVMDNPLGQPSVFEISSFTLLLVSWLSFIVIGIAGGSVFFGEIARLSAKAEFPFSFRRSLKLFKHTVILTISAYLLVLIIAIPVMLLVSILSLISPVFTQVTIIFISLILIWLLMPLIFSPHGIFSYEQNVFTAAINSIRLVRYFLPGTGIFLLMAVLISQGLDILWTFPPEQSWMTMIGIFGHAFVMTGLIASSFVYYRGGIQWMNEKLQRFAGTNTASAQQD